MIELLIALAILAIVAAIALPLYDRYSKRTYRAEAQADLIGCAQALERHAALNLSYEGAAERLTAGELCELTSVSHGRYVIDLRIPAGETSRFLISATPVVGGPMANDGILTYDDAGQRTWDRDNDGLITPAERTWQD